MGASDPLPAGYEIRFGSLEFRAIDNGYLMDLLRQFPLQKAPGSFTHLLVAIDKFSKCIEARPIGKIRSEQAVLFFIDIVFRFGVPNSIITDNAPSSRARSSWRSATATIYAWTGRLWRTHR